MILNLMFSYPTSFWGKQALFHLEMHDVSCVQNQAFPIAVLKSIKNINFIKMIFSSMYSIRHPDSGLYPELCLSPRHGLCSWTQKSALCEHVWVCVHVCCVVCMCYVYVVCVHAVCVVYVCVMISPVLVCKLATGRHQVAFLSLPALSWDSRSVSLLVPCPLSTEVVGALDHTQLFI